MIVLVSGSTGLVGSALIEKLLSAGYTVHRLLRAPTVIQRNGDVVWDPSTGRILSGPVDRIDAVVHLAGESIAAGRWTAAKKKRIHDSRVDGTRALVKLILSWPKAPSVFVSASAIGYYGDRGEETLVEESFPGKGFLPDVCREWESAAEPLAAHDVRVVNLRFGVVLSAKGGALKAMLPPFKMGVGGKIGSGRQFMSWVSLDDVVDVACRALNDDGLRGPVNVVSPHPVTNEEFTKALGRVLSRPTVFPLPAFAARLVLGEMADALLLASARVMPKQLEAVGYKFQHTRVEEALRSALFHRA